MVGKGRSGLVLNFTFVFDTNMHHKGLRRESSRVWTVVSRQSWLSWLVRCEVDVSSYCGRMAWYESDSIGVGNRPGRMVDESLLQKSIRPGVLVDESFFAKSNTPGRIG